MRIRTLESYRYLCGTVWFTLINVNCIILFPSDRYTKLRNIQIDGSLLFKARREGGLEQQYASRAAPQPNLEMRWLVASEKDDYR
jgi:hypothetical protein